MKKRILSEGSAVRRFSTGFLTVGRVVVLARSNREQVTM